ncbi:hypothetical protein NM432_18500 (plasmid) [Vibrio metschnikovii]
MIKFNFINNGKVNVHGVIYVGLMAGSALYFNSLLLPWMHYSMDMSYFLLYPLMVYAFFFMATPVVSGIFMTWFSYNHLDYGLFQAGVFSLIQLGICYYAMENPCAVRCFVIKELSASNR